MKKNQIIENVLIEDIAAGGKAIARIDGKIIFIEDAIPGDEVNIRIIKNKKDWGEAKIVSYQKYSPDRQTPFCSHFGVCGGCVWQMLPYHLQLKYKQQQVEEQLQHLTKLNYAVEMLPIVGAEPTTLYRNKLEYTFSTKEFFPYLQKTNEVVPNPLSTFAVGFHPKRFFDKVVNIEKCFLQQEPTNELRNFIKKFAIEHNYSCYDIRNHTGYIRNLQVRICTTGEWFANIVLADDNEETRNKLLDAIIEKFPSITTLFYTINKKFNDSILDLSPQTYYGKGFIVERLGNYEFKIGPKSFFQTNSYQALKLYETIVQLADFSPSDVVYDLYCGAGSIGIFVSQHVKKIVGVELIDEAIKDANENAQQNNLKDFLFFSGDVIDVCNDDFFATNGKPSVVIVDPPRAGLHEKLINKLLEIASPKIIYVSCNPATQMRDLQLLSAKYELKTIQPVDLFPYTHHIETVALLKLRITN